MMMTLLVAQQEGDVVRVPKWPMDLAAFRRWARSGEFPHRGLYAFLNGSLWIDPSDELESHNQVKTEICSVLVNAVKDPSVGRIFSDRIGLTNVDADLCTEPDGMFARSASLHDRRVRLTRRANLPELIGSPDMVLEVISPTSAQKDALLLRDLYWRAGIPEYWLVDPALRMLQRHVLRDGQYAIVEAVGDSTIFKPDSFPGLKIPLARLWSLHGKS